MILYYAIKTTACMILELFINKLINKFNKIHENVLKIGSFFLHMTLNENLSVHSQKLQEIHFNHSSEHGALTMLFITLYIFTGT